VNFTILRTEMRETVYPAAHDSMRAGSGRFICLVVAAGMLAGCSPDVPSPVAFPTEASLGKSPGTTTLAVTSASPSSAPQDTVLDVVVNGSGFERGASARWSLAGDTSLVHVVSTTYVSAGQLKVRLQVPANAPVSTYDVVVYLVTGKRGVGSELFAVKLGDPQTMLLIPTDDAALSVHSDHLYTSGAYSVYDNGVCGVNAKIFATLAYSNSGDAIMHTDNAKFTDRKCSAYPRKLRVFYPDGTSELGTAFVNLRGIENTTYAIPIGVTVKRALHINTGGAQCGALHWSNMYSGTPVPGDSVLVTRVDGQTWDVESQPYPNDQTYCANAATTYHMPVKLRVVSHAPVW
jgi:hypothetical protein